MLCLMNPECKNVSQKIVTFSTVLRFPIIVRFNSINDHCLSLNQCANQYHLWIMNQWMKHSRNSECDKKHVGKYVVQLSFETYIHWRNNHNDFIDHKTLQYKLEQEMRVQSRFFHSISLVSLFSLAFFHYLHQEIFLLLN